MPVTARLSKNFYDRFGDDVANELVEWFNSVDATYRAEQREINERFAGIDRRFDAIEALLREQLVKIDGRLDRFEARLMRWMLSFWVGTLIGLAALVWAMVRAR